MAEVILEVTNQEFKSTQIWEGLFREASLTDLVANTFPMGVRDEARNQKRLLSLGDYLRIFANVIVLLFTDPETRALLKYAGSNATQYFENMGYGLFVGKKPTIG